MAMSIIVLGGQYHVAKGYRHVPKNVSIEGCYSELNLNVTTTPKPQ